MKNATTGYWFRPYWMRIQARIGECDAVVHGFLSRVQQTFSLRIDLRFESALRVMLTKA